MKLNLIYMAVGLGLVITGCRSVKPNPLEIVYKDYVLYSCLERGYDAKDAFEKDLTLSIYNDVTGETISQGPIAHYLDSLVKRKIDSIPFAEAPGAQDRKVIFKSCMDYYNSKELHDEIIKVLKMKKDFDKKFDEEIKKAVPKKSPLKLN